MSNEDLSKYIVKFGDRCAVRRFCTKATSTTPKAGNLKKTSLLQKLKKKLHARSSKDESQSTESEDETVKDKRRKTLKGNSNAVKNGRTIKMGWKHFENSDYIQVRSDKGGGTDDIFVPKSFTKADLLERAKSMFFQEGLSSKGREEELEFDMADFRSQPLDDNVTIGELFKKTNRKNLRYYLFTKPKNENQSKKLKRNEKRKSQKHLKPIPLPQDSDSEDDSSIQREAAMAVKSEKACSSRPSSSLNVNFVSDPDIPGPSGEQSIKASNMTSNKSEIPGPSGLCTSANPHLLSQEDIPGTSGFHTSEYVTFHESDSDTLPDLHDYFGTVRSMQVTMPDGTQEEVIYSIDPNDSGIVQLNLNNQEIVSDEVLIRVHRGHALKELLEAFSNTLLLPNSRIKIQMILPNGSVEQAQDEGGVTRDCLTEFWEEFYATCTVGKDCKVPYLRHDFGHQQWEAVGKIIKYGFEEFGHFPVYIARPFMEYCIVGEAKTDLKDTFLSYVSPSEASVLKQALAEFDKVDLDELNEIMQSYDCRRLLTSDNIETIVKEISHKEIVQKSMFVIDSFKLHLHGLMSEAALCECYKNLVPNNRRVIEKLSFPEILLEKGAEMKRYLQRFIRELDKEALGKFLRFSTGSDLMLKEIRVRFSSLDGFARRVIAHTCGCVLEIPTSYDNYVEFRAEFMSVLKSDVWVMDME